MSSLIDPLVALTFVPAVTAVVISPGPDSVYALTQSLNRDRTAGIAAATGTATGILIHSAAAILGLSALLRTTAEAYALLKYAGAAYLIYLGIRLLRDDEGFSTQGHVGDEGHSFIVSYRKAVTINVTNPQVAVFVFAFFPQFVPSTTNAALQLSFLGLVYAGLSFLYLVGVALLADRIRPFLFDSTATRRAVRYASGSVLVGFGLKLIFDKGQDL